MTGSISLVASIERAAGHGGQHVGVRCVEVDLETEVRERMHATVMRLSGVWPTSIQPVMSSSPKRDSLQWASCVPGPPVDSTGTLQRVLHAEQVRVARPLPTGR